MAPTKSDSRLQKLREDEEMPARLAASCSAARSLKRTSNGDWVLMPVSLGTKCKHEFCWDCLVDHLEVLKHDNRVHKADCPWHPDNLHSGDRLELA